MTLKQLLHNIDTTAIRNLLIDASSRTANDMLLSKFSHKVEEGSTNFKPSLVSIQDLLNNNEILELTCYIKGIQDNTLYILLS